MCGGPATQNPAAQVAFDAGWVRKEIVPAEDDEDTKDALFREGVSEELLQGRMTQDAKVWQDMQDRPRLEKRHQEATHHFMQNLARISGLSIYGWQVAVRLFDLACRDERFVKQMSANACKGQAVAATALILVLRKDEQSWDAPRATDLTYCAARFAEYLLKVEQPGEEPQVLVEKEDIWKQVQQLLCALDYELHVPCLASWIEVVCKRTNIYSKTIFSEKLRSVCQQSQHTSNFLLQISPRTLQMQPRRVANGLVCLFLVVARMLPSEEVQPFQVESSDWQRLLRQALAASLPGQSTDDSGLPRCDLDRDEVLTLLESLSAATRSTLEELQQDAFEVATLMTAIQALTKNCYPGQHQHRV
ncbi:unnamed protein product [Effrenium voratum]|uniref:Uncharacterized protein n=1 Tax=Effrenium voratum TaxID=2562239 RepID=A0AA36IWB3_9DINO|nr:unnamed protein product [Effrenium voratum]CAJ1449399.1 unnamed protein product [Effrenium voratum]